MEKSEIEKQIKEIEEAMLQGDFWDNKVQAQESIRKLEDLKNQLEGVGKFDKGDAIVSILAGAGGDDSEDFARMLLGMYDAYFDKKGYIRNVMHANENDHGGYRNITLEVKGKFAYGNLQHESGVHRLVRISPFNASAKRHTSFAMVEVMPVLDDVAEVTLKPDDLRFEYSKSSGPGGQNVNKRETAVRVVHIPTGLSASSDNERQQEANREAALKLLRGKLYKALMEEHAERIEDLKISGTTSIEWGNQIRSYVLHPYKMVKDHRTDVEVRDVERVLERGEIEPFIEAMKTMDNSVG